jgi:hypothetical protein
VSESLLDAFVVFFDGIPDAVREELSFFLVALTDEERIYQDEPPDYERAARALFSAQTRIGRIGNLIQAAAIFDVYFSADLDQRFAASARHPEIAGGSSRLVAAFGRRADRINAIAAARDEWHMLRRTTLSPAAISAALIAPDVSRRNHGQPEAAPVAPPTA